MNNTSVLSVAKNRVVWLDVVRFVAMFTVVCCHCADPFNFYSGEPSAELEQIKFWAAVHRIQLEVVGDIFFRVVKHISCRWLYLLMLIIIRTLFGREGYVNHHTSCPGFFPVFQFSNGIFSFFY